MPLRPCSFEGCVNPAERNWGSCTICTAHLCYQHMLPPYHSCPQQSLEPGRYFSRVRSALHKHHSALFERIDLRALEAVAGNARGVPCSIPCSCSPQARYKLFSAQMGGQNCHIDVKFEDGVTWIARLRLHDPVLAPARIRDYITESEVAVLRFLESTLVPAPRVFRYTLSTSIDEVGAPYTLMEKVDGRPLDWQHLGEVGREKVLAQLADIYIELQKHPFDRLGSPIQHVGSAPDVEGETTNLIIGPFAQMQAFVEPTTPLGPYDTVSDAAKAIISAYLDRYGSGELDDFALDAFLTHKWRLQLVDRLYGHGSGCKPHFFLRHFEDKGDHIMVDEQYNITGIIDWEFASVECGQVAFNSPCMIWPVGRYYDGFNELSAAEEQFADALEDKGAADLARLVRLGRLHQRFWFFTTGDSSVRREELVSLFDGLRKAASQHFDEGELVPYETWREQALQRELQQSPPDPRLLSILRRQPADISANAHLAAPSMATTDMNDVGRI